MNKYKIFSELNKRWHTLPSYTTEEKDAHIYSEEELKKFKDQRSPEELKNITIFKVIENLEKVFEMYAILSPSLKWWKGVGCGTTSVKDDVEFYPSSFTTVSKAVLVPEYLFDEMFDLVEFMRVNRKKEDRFNEILKQLT